MKNVKRKMQSEKRQLKIKKICFAFWVVVFSFPLLVFRFAPAEAATLSLSPASGSFTVGGTFDLRVVLDTEGKAVNAVSVLLQFPSDRLQLTSPIAGKSIISLWASPPRFDNQKGTVTLQGLIPDGINTTSGLVTTLTFRVRTPGQAVVKFLTGSDVLLHDGEGTSALKRLQNGIYELVLPPPAGPIVASVSHPDQFHWYSDPTVALTWAGEEEDLRGFSYILNQEPADEPDDILEGSMKRVTYRNLAEGTYYFHIKAMRRGVFGGTTHFRMNIDTTPPAAFPVDIIPSARTSRRQPLIQFVTSDALSGLDHYELKIISLLPSVPAAGTGTAEQPFFIEVQSPFVPPVLETGQYDVIIRAFDKAGNYQETIKRLSITSTVLRFISDQGLEISSQLIVPWLWLLVAAAALATVLGLIAWFIYRWHYRLDQQWVSKKLPAEVKANLNELKKFRQKYGKTLMVLLIITTMFWAAPPAVAEETLGLGPPLITTVSSAISNREIFYAGGRVRVGQGQVILYLQNINTGETWNYRLVPDERGEWFYIHNVFMASGRYLLWAQSQAGNELSPPSPQREIVVQPTALEFGVSRLSLEVFYLLLTIVFAVLNLALFIYIGIHFRRGRKKRRLLAQEIKEAEESVRRGFAVLRRDIEAELQFIKKAKLNRGLLAAEKKSEAQLLKDLTLVEKYIGKEIWDIDKAEAG